MGLGLVTAVLLRDEYRLQPPVLFVDIFGLPLIGIAIGTVLDRWRANSTRRPSTVMFVGSALALGVAPFTIAVLGLGDRSTADNCETVGGVTRCELFWESKP